MVYTYNRMLFNLKKGSPVGAMTWGNGSVNNESISTLAKDFREEIEAIRNELLPVPITTSGCLTFSPSHVKAFLCQLPRLCHIFAHQLKDIVSGIPPPLSCTVIFFHLWNDFSISK